MWALAALPGGNRFPHTYGSQAVMASGRLPGRGTRLPRRGTRHSRALRTPLPLANKSPALEKNYTE